VYPPNLFSETVGHSATREHDNVPPRGFWWTILWPQKHNVESENATILTIAICLRLNHRMNGLMRVWLCAKLHACVHVYIWWLS